MDYKMDYETFRQEMKKLVEEGLRGKGEYSLSWNTVHKNNVTKKGLMISEEGSLVSLSVYFDQPYQEYLGGRPLSDISREIIEMNVERCCPDVSALPLKDYGKMKEKLRVRLVGREQNEAYLEEGPYKLHPMGAEILYAELGNSSEGAMRMHVTHQNLQEWDVPVQGAFEAALENSQREEGVQFQSMTAVTASILGAESPEEETFDKKDIYVLTNQSRDHGAAVLLYPGVLEDVHKKMEGDYYILPSSLHEVLILSKEVGFTPAELRKMVVEVNREQVDPEEQLGNDVYEFQGKTGTLQKCKVAEKEKTR
nr:DUF5688 family protein [uncultured Schaedlerella sp.]